MSSVRTAIAGAILACVAFAPAAVADEMGGDDMNRQLQLLQRRMQQLEDRLSATQEELDAARMQVQAQEEMIARTAPSPIPSGVAGFLSRLEIGGWMSGTYWYNFNDPDNDNLFGANQGVSGSSIPFNPDANQFSFDQLWFELEHPVSPEHRAGFRADIVFGKVAGLLPNGNTPEEGRAGGNNLYINQAYVQYLMPAGERDVHWKFGKWATLIGYEVPQTTGNWNITRSNTYNLLQPIDHVGILASGEEAGLSWNLGITNNVFTTQTTQTDGKAITGSVGYGIGDLSLSVAGIFGTESGNATTTYPGLFKFSDPDCLANPFVGNPACDTGGDEDFKIGIIDVIAEYAVNDKLTLAANADYGWIDADDGRSPTAWGVAGYANYRWSERLGTTLRFDFVRDEEDFFGIAGALADLEDDGAFWVRKGRLDNSQIISVTLTSDYMLTDNLMVRGEVRYDQADVDGFSDDVFISDGDRLVFGDDDQWLAGAEVIYTF